jgi:hypothetical protein
VRQSGVVVVVVDTGSNHCMHAFAWSVGLLLQCLVAPIEDIVKGPMIRYVYR